MTPRQRVALAQFERLVAAELLLAIVLPKCDAADCGKYATRTKYGGTPLCDQHARDTSSELPYAPHVRAWVATWELV